MRDRREARRRLREQSKIYDRGWVSLACFRSNFGGLVLGCMDSYDSNQILILQHFSRSTRFAFLCTAQISKFQEKSSIVGGMKWNFISFRFWSMNLVIFLRSFDGILSEFHGYSQKMMKCLEFLIKSARKMRKKADISGIGAKFHSFISFVQSSPYSSAARQASPSC